MATILITGGGSGIGLALAERFLAHGDDVVVCGRRAGVLEEAGRRHPGLVTRVCDLAAAEGRIALFEWALREHPELSVLVNNAGIQQRVELGGVRPWRDLHQEIAINFEAPVHLAELFLPHLLRQPQAAIVNVTSGLAFAPLARVPVYCATKAALRSFTLSLRHQLADTAVRVVEVIPPAVDTDLGGPGLHTFGVPVERFAEAVFAAYQAGETEIATGMARDNSRASRAELDALFERMNSS